MKLARPAVANTLAKIFNISIESGTFPEDWKRLMLCQFIKKGAKDDFRNYRSVSVCRIWRELLPKDCSYILECMVWLQKVSMAFVKEDHVLPNWLPCIMTGLLFLVSSLHPELMLCFLTGLKHLTKLVTACYCPNFTSMAYAVKCLSGLLLTYMVEFRGFNIVASFPTGLL